MFWRYIEFEENITMSLNFLIVDDSETVRQVLERTIRISGLDAGEVYHACNGAEALAVLKNEWIDIALTDLNMPEMDGFELIEQIRNDPDLINTPVIVVTGRGGHSHEGRLHEAGVLSCIRKPFCPETIRDTIIEALGLQ